MRLFLLLVGFGLTASFAHAELTGIPDLQSKIQNDLFEALPPKGHHFNAKAPATVKEGDSTVPFKLTEAKLKVTLPLSASEQELSVDVFVCDDANTFCKKKNQHFKIPPVSTAERTRKKSPEASVGKPAVVSFEKDTDFFVNDPKGAFAQAEKLKLPLMIDFFGIWCPPCNHLDAMIFRSTEFRKKTSSRFVKLKIDSDHEEFNELKNRYKIQGYPTVVLATTTGDEIFRLVGYQPLDEFLAKADAAYASREESYVQLAAKASGGNAEARYKAARIALDRDEPAKALEWLEPLRKLLEAEHDPRMADVYRAQLGVAQAAKDAAQSRRTLEAWLQAFPVSPDALENIETLADLQKNAGESDEAVKATLARGVVVADKLIASGEAALKGSACSPADVAQSRALLLEKLGDTTKTREAFLACATAYQQQALAEGTQFPRGPNLERAYCFGKAGEIAKSEALYKEGIRRFPKEYTFYQGLAKLWLDWAKKPEKALPESKKAVQHSYGNQRLRAMLTLAKTYEALKQPKKAIETIEAALEAPVAEGTTPRTLELRENLRVKADELRKKANPVAS